MRTFPIDIGICLDKRMTKMTVKASHRKRASSLWEICQRRSIKMKDSRLLTPIQLCLAYNSPISSISTFANPNWPRLRLFTSFQHCSALNGLVSSHLPPVFSK